MSESKTFDRYVVVGVNVESGEKEISGEGFYYPFDEATFNEAVLGRRDAAAALAEMRGDAQYRDVTVHKLVLGPELTADQVNVLFDI